MNWDDVRLFLSIAEAGSFRKAALDLNVGHSTLSRRIESLEESLGVKLFVRVNRGLSLTPAGDEMLKTAIPMGEEFDRLQIRLFGQDQTPTGKITLTSSDIFIGHLLPLQEFMSKWPDIIIEVNTSMVVLDLATVEADIAIRITNSPSEQLIGRKLGPYCEAAYASPEYLKAFLAAPICHQFISPGKSYQFQMNLDPKYEAPLKTSLISPNIRTQFDMALRGVGIACLPCLIGDQSEGLIPISDTVERASIWLLAHRDSRNNERMRIFREFIVDQFELKQDLLKGKRE